MSQVFDLLFTCFERIVSVMRSIEIFAGVISLTVKFEIVIVMEREEVLLKTK